MILTKEQMLIDLKGSIKQIYNMSLDYPKCHYKVTDYTETFYFEYKNGEMNLNGDIEITPEDLNSLYEPVKATITIF